MKESALIKQHKKTYYHQLTYLENIHSLYERIAEMYALPFSKNVNYNYSKQQRFLNKRFKCIIVY